MVFVGRTATGAALDLSGWPHTPPFTEKPPLSSFQRPWRRWSILIVIACNRLSIIDIMIIRKVTPTGESARPPRKRSSP
jgi:hypothetical protein